jgi:hypothetical protein
MAQVEADSVGFRSSRMRSLSLPNRIQEYAEEIRELEERILADKANKPGDSLKLRSMTNMKQHDDSTDEDMLRRRTDPAAYSDSSNDGGGEEDFFVGGFEEEPYHDPIDCGDETPPSFLPGFDGGELDSQRITQSIEPIVEESPEEGHNLAEEEHPPQTEDATRRKEALETVEALASLLDIPMAISDPAEDSSPVSVRGIWQGKDVAKAAKPEEPSEKSETKSHRSIFQQYIKSDGFSPSWSGFGMFSAHQNPRDKKLEQVSSSPKPHVFRMLKNNDRAESMPTRLPRKSSLKRFPSMLSSSTHGSGSTTSLKRTVSFGKLETREFNIALSDHPSCSYGPPISLGWDFRDKEAVTLETYEEKRSPRRSMHQMVLSYNVRRYLLLKRAGYSSEDLQDAMNEVDRVKRNRLVTDLLLPASKIDETVENVVEHLKGIFGSQPSS